eukprot:Blabericola_migrator_1__7641@NODE_38_length_17790_cov_195_231733_g34_i0_p2_GENE_NODE_38_length_17790_cov_195_231733_g34_i0NODE_38_length_17790_cov_195_231733_g34_i0_p2_ORF_typecomplete_len1030_score212_93Acyl_transf_3/PF01757_22/2_4e03Acyl_transf_3/PF01757_22/2e29_NODE_38_length_17790_cov_195_231733_g34_i01213815227
MHAIPPFLLIGIVYGERDSFCKDSLLTWIETQGIVSLFQPSLDDLNTCKDKVLTIDHYSHSDHEQVDPILFGDLYTPFEFCFIKKRSNIPLPRSLRINTTDEEEVSMSLTWSACLPVSCSSPSVVLDIINDMCQTRSCSTLDTLAEKQLCVVAHTLHCDSVARLQVDTPDTLYLHCATPPDTTILARKLSMDDTPNTHTLTLQWSEMESLCVCGSSFLRDWKLVYLSGSLQDLGDYDTCKDFSPSTSYCLIEFFDVLASGRCVPSACTETNINRMFHYICDRIGTDGMAYGVESTCLDYINVIPIDLCVLGQLIGCQNFIDMRDMTNGDVTQLIHTLLHPHTTHNTTVNMAGITDMVFDEIRSAIGSYFKNLVPSFYQQSGVGGVWPTQQIDTGDDTLPTYILTCNPEPVPKEGKDWHITLMLISVAFIVLPLLGLFALTSHDTEVTPTAYTHTHRHWRSCVKHSVGRWPRLNSILKCFSVSENLRVCDTARHKVVTGSFPHVDGLRALSIVWIIVGHSFVFGGRPGTLHNLQDVSKIWNSFTFQIVYSAQFAVDTFFFVGGLMLGFVGPRKVAGQLRPVFDDSGNRLRTSPFKIVKVWIQMVAQRFFRIVGLFYYVLALSYYSIQFVSFAPRWPTLLRHMRTGMEGGCQKYWWALAILINNLYPEQALTECFGQAWFLANDFQFFSIGAMLVILAHFGDKRFEIVWWTLMISCIIASWWTVLHYDIRLPATYLSGMDPTLSSTNHKSYVAGAVNNMMHFYSKPWCRMPPYLLGIYYGKLFTQGTLARHIGVDEKEETEKPTHDTHTGGSNIPTLPVPLPQYTQIHTPDTHSPHNSRPPSRYISSQDTAMAKEGGGDIVHTSITNMCAVITLLFLIFIPYEANRAGAPQWDWVFDAAYMATSRTVWAVALGWLVCLLSYTVPRPSKKITHTHTPTYERPLKDGISALIGDFLRHPIFSYFSLISYALYLVHIPLQEVYYASQKKAFALTEGVGWFNGLCFVGLSSLVAATLFVFVELPVASLVKLFIAI